MVVSNGIQVHASIANHTAYRASLNHDVISTLRLDSFQLPYTTPMPAADTRNTCAPTIQTRSYRSVCIHDRHWMGLAAAQEL